MQDEEYDEDELDQDGSTVEEVTSGITGLSQISNIIVYYVHQMTVAQTMGSKAKSSWRRISCIIDSCVWYICVFCI